MSNISNIDCRKYIPEEWVVSNYLLIPSGGKVLDLACGNGRNTRLLLKEGYKVTAVDRDISKIIDLKNDRNLKIVEYDLEDGSDWPFGGGKFDGIVVVNYLFRPLFPHILGSLKSNGILVYHTFAQGNEYYGHPKNPDFLLRRDELKEFFGKSLEVLEFNQGIVYSPRPAVIQQICCRLNT